MRLVKGSMPVDVTEQKKKVCFMGSGRGKGSGAQRIKGLDIMEGPGRDSKTGRCCGGQGEKDRSGRWELKRETPGGRTKRGE